MNSKSVKKPHKRNSNSGTPVQASSEEDSSSSGQSADDDYPTVCYDATNTVVETEEAYVKNYWRYSFNKKSDTNTKFVINYSMQDSNTSMEATIKNTLNPVGSDGRIQQSTIWREFKFGTTVNVKHSADNKKQVQQCVYDHDSKDV